MMRWDMGTATLSVYDSDDFLGVQVDVLGDEAKAGIPPVEVVHPYGFFARPPERDSDGLGCGVLYAYQGNKTYAWLANDPRKAPKLPILRPGESIHYGPKGQFLRMHEDGSISAATFLGGDPDSYSIFLKLDVTSGLIVRLPWGELTFGPQGFHVRHSSGARIDLGSIGGLPAPLDALSSYVKLTAAIASVNAGAVSIGTDAGATNEAAVASLLTLLAALAAAIDSKAGSTTATVAAVAAAAPLIGQLGKDV